MEHQAERIERRIQECELKVGQYRTLGFGFMVGGILLTIISLAKLGLLGPVVPIVAVVAFMWVSNLQKKASKSLLLYQALLRFLHQQQARSELDWNAMPAVPLREEMDDGDVSHPFDLDLDISGERSLHRLLNTAVSLEGMLRLRDWLLTRDLDPEVIRARRALVRELIPLSGFRRKLMTYSLFATRFSTSSVDGERLLDWLEKQSGSKMRISTLAVALALSILMYTTLILYFLVHLSPLYFIVTLILNAVWFLLKRSEQGHLLEDVSYQRVAFGQLRIVFEYLEKYRYGRNVQLKQLCEPYYLHPDRRPSVLLKKLEQVFSRTSTIVSSNEAWFVLNLLVPIGAVTAYQLDQYKAQLIDRLPDWLDTWYELEALCSLANFAALNPEYTFPELVTTPGQGKDADVESMIFSARALGHPLIPKKQKVVNDLILEQPGEIMLMTGSNMAGKSTFLRTLGINLCLAYAGSVVNATSLRVSLFEVYACIRVTDSLADGYSYFYAEVRRLREMLDELKEGPRYPLFFLIDEIFKGTNNYERLIGSEAYIRALVGQRCTGAISTHDLELVRLSETFPCIKNYHFRENITDGRMTFEYRLRLGPSPTRNALRIMEMEGLPVRWEGEPAAQPTP